MEAEPAAEAMARLYDALTPFDEDGLRPVLAGDVFVMGPVANSVQTSRDEVVADLRRWSARLMERRQPVTRRAEPVVGVSPSGASAWVFDRVDLCSTEARVTALLTLEETWRVTAAHWSVPYGTQEAQDHDKHTGVLPAGAELPRGPGDAADLAGLLRSALADPRTLPDLYTDGPDHVTLGSVVSEVFLGSAGRAAWSEFVQDVDAFTLRGPVCGAVVGDAAWLAANIGIGSPPTPYRFFYVWVRRGTQWRICVSHDSVSRDPLLAS